MQTNIQIIMIFSGKDNHVWPFLSLCSLTNVLSLGKHDKWFCPNFNNHLAKTKLVLHCNGPNFGQKPIEIFRCRLYSARVLKSQHHSPPVTAMPLTSLSSLLHSWELNTYLYVMSNTLYKDRGVFLFFFLFLSCIITASSPCQSHRCTEDSSCYHNDTHFTCVSHAQEDNNRKNGEIF